MYGGHGLCHSLIKLHCHTVFSSLGMVVLLPNKYSERDELYVLEITRNPDNILDAFSDTVRNGVCLFRLIERFHHFHGDIMSLAPLHVPLTKIQSDKLVDWVWRLHATTFLPYGNIDMTRSVYMNFLPFLQTRFGIDYRKSPFLTTDIFAAPLILQAIREIQILSDRELDSANSFHPLSIASLPCFDSIRPLRELKTPDELRSFRQQLTRPPVLQRTYSSHLDSHGLQNPNAVVTPPSSHSPSSSASSEFSYPQSSPPCFPSASLQSLSLPPHYTSTVPFYTSSYSPSSLFGPHYAYTYQPTQPFFYDNTPLIPLSLYTPSSHPPTSSIPASLQHPSPFNPFPDTSEPPLPVASPPSPSPSPFSFSPPPLPVSPPLERPLPPLQKPKPIRTRKMIRNRSFSDPSRDRTETFALANLSSSTVELISPSPSLIFFSESGSESESESESEYGTESDL